MNIIYQGLFIEGDLIKNELEKRIKDIHITFKFRPTKEEYMTDYLGKEFQIKVVGYANDGQNEGYQVEIPTELEHEYKGAKVPHITISVSSTGKPVDTAKLDFVPITSFIVVGKVGFFTPEGVVFSK